MFKVVNGKSAETAVTEMIAGAAGIVTGAVVTGVAVTGVAVVVNAEVVAMIASVALMTMYAT